MDPTRTGQHPTTGSSRSWEERRLVAIAIRTLAFATPIAISVIFVAFASRAVPRPDGWWRTALWWTGMTIASTIVLAATERVLRRLLPLAALFRLSLVFPDRAPSRFKTAMRTNTLRQLQRSLDAGESVGEASFQDAAEVLVALAGALNAHDRMTRGHTERVRAYTYMIGEQMHLPTEDLEKLHWAGLVHDVGKLEVPRSILNKPGRPDKEEWAILSQHPAAGGRLVEPLRGWLGDWADAASQHHEKHDGTGYPAGLKGHEISLSGRIVAVADAYDVMTSVRSYKKAMAPEDARAELARCAGTQFDPDVVRAFLNISVGKLRLVMGPLSWLAQAPVVGNIPIGTAVGSAMTGLATVVAAGVLGIGGGSPSPASAPSELAFASPPVATPIRMVLTEDTPGRTEAPWERTPDRIRLTAEPANARVEFGDDVAARPARDFFGVSKGEYTACWDRICSASTIELIVEPVNDTPEAVVDVARTDEDVPATVDVLANDHDVDDVDLTVTFADLAPAFAGSVVTTADGRVDFLPAPDFSGRAVLPYTAADSSGSTADAAIEFAVQAVNDVPTATDDTLSAVAGSTATVYPLVNDADADGDALRISRVTAGEALTATTDGQSIAVTPPTGTSGITTLTYTVVDGYGGSDTAVVTLAVLVGAHPPMAIDDRADLLEDGDAHFVDVLANDSDPEGSTAQHTVSIVSGPQVGDAAVTGHHVVYAPDPSVSGTDSLLYQVCDPTGLCATATIHVSITPVNDPPDFSTTGGVTVGEDSGPVVVPGWATNRSAGPSDESGQGLDFDVQVDDPSLFATAPAVTPGGDLTFEPAPNAHGTATMTATLRDDGGTTNGGADTSPPHSATITVSSVNDPVVVLDDIGIVGEDDPAGVTVDVLSNDSDVDGDTLTVTSVDTSGVVGGELTGGSGTYTYVPDANFNGTEVVTYDATDGNGSTVAGTLTITVNAVPDAPLAVADAYAIAEDAVLNVPAAGVLANDADPDGDVVTANPTLVSAPINGIATLAADGSFDYAPTTGFVGTDSFTYGIDDGTGRTATSIVTITVDSGTTSSSLYLGTTASGGNWGLRTTPLGAATPEPDHDSDGGPGFFLKKRSILDLLDLDPARTLTWTRTLTQDLQLNGPVTLHLWSAVRDLRPDRDAELGVVLYDCDSSGLFCSQIAAAAPAFDPYNGTTSWADVPVGLGNVSHTFSSGRQLRLRVRVSREDLWIAASGGRPSRIDMTIANQAPVAASDTAPIVDEDSGTLNVDVLANDVDTNLDPGSVSVVAAPTRGSAVVGAGGTIDYTAASDENGADLLTYQVCDTSGLCDTATLALNIRAVNDRPTFTAGSDVTIAMLDPPYSAPWATTISNGPADEAGQTSTFGVTVSDPALFLVQPTIAPDGTLTFTSAGTAGFADVDVVLTDDGGTANGGNPTSVTRTFRITITP